MPRGFYITLALVPLGLAALKFSHDGGNDADGVVPYLTRVIGDWSAYGDRWTARNALHTTMIEQAAHDRNLFQSTRGSATVELKFPEYVPLFLPLADGRDDWLKACVCRIFNTGSPYNVPAGHGGANLDTLIAHYEKENREVEERKARALETSRRE
ncbi:MAG: hypothetical protein M1832_002045 [Thelocarpon impressellum]|nr:MAG: hypothetical protein M1832_002045 [Thelocarpon impressellum]